MIAISIDSNQSIVRCPEIPFVPNTTEYAILVGLGVSDFLVCLCVLVMRGFSSMRIEAISDFGEYLVPIVTPLSMMAYSAEVGMTVFLSFERYLGGFHLSLL